MSAVLKKAVKLNHSLTHLWLSCLTALSHYLNECWLSSLTILRMHFLCKWSLYQSEYIFSKNKSLEIKVTFNWGPWINSCDLDLTLQILHEFKFEFLRIVCNHEHYIQLNLPIMRKAVKNYRGKRNLILFFYVNLKEEMVGNEILQL